MLGFQDECWWSRLAQPDVSTWTDADPLRLIPPGKAKGDGPAALACYGIYRRDTGGMMLRFVDGRPVSQVTEDFLAWACGAFAGEGKRVFVLVWDNAAWHVSKRVRRWIETHNRRVRRTKRGVPHPGVRAAGQGSVAEPDRAEVDAREAGDRRTRPQAHRRRDQGASVCSLRMHTHRAPQTGCRLILH